MSKINKMGRRFFLGILFLLAACQSPAGIPGVDQPINVQDGTIQVKKVERVSSIGEGATEAKAPDGFDLLLVTVALTGKVPLAEDFFNSKWVIVDAAGDRIPQGGLYQGKLIFKTKKDAKGLVLWLADQASVPLGTLLGEAPSAVNQPSTQAVNQGTITMPSLTFTPTPKRLYVVREGDTLTAIALMHGLSVEVILDVNKVNEDELQVGQVLVVPLPTDQLYEVQAGDSLNDIAAKFGVSALDITLANNLASDQVTPGQVLVIPAK